MRILLAGDGGFMKDLLFAFKYENTVRSIVVYTNNIPTLKSNPYFDSYNFIEKDEQLVHFFKNESPLFIVAIESPVNRRFVTEKLTKLGGYNVSFLSSQSLISRFNIISEQGVIIQMSCDVSNDVTIGKSVLIGMKSLIGHDAQIGEYTTIGTGTSILGYVKIGNNCEIGPGVTIMPKIEIGNNVKISANSLIKKDVPSNTTL